MHIKINRYIDTYEALLPANFFYTCSDICWEVIEFFPYLQVYRSSFAANMLQHKVKYNNSYTVTTLPHVKEITQ
jgi:hypothetical protein